MASPGTPNTWRTPASARTARRLSVTVMMIPIDVESVMSCQETSFVRCGRARRRAGGPAVVTERAARRFHLPDEVPSGGLRRLHAGHWSAVGAPRASVHGRRRRRGVLQHWRRRGIEQGQAVGRCSHWRKGWLSSLAQLARCGSAHTGLRDPVRWSPDQGPTSAACCNDRKPPASLRLRSEETDRSRETERSRRIRGSDDSDLRCRPVTNTRSASWPGNTPTVSS